MTKSFKIFSLVLLFSFIQTNIYAQDDLLNMLDEEMGDEPIYTLATFKSTRIINGHSIESMKKHQLDFRINHRFGKINSGAYELYGLDNAIINFLFEYGVTDWMQIGIRRGTYQKTYDGSLKFKILRQSTGSKVMPFTLSYYTNMSINTLKLTDPNAEDLFSNRLAFAHQILIGRKFGEKLSLQLSPSMVHRNIVQPDQKNDIYAVGIGGRYKFIRRVAFTFEYFYTTQSSVEGYYNPLAIGFDVETGGHVFQLFFTNSRPMVEKGFLGETTSSWGDGGIYFGFNMSRVFAVGGEH